MANTVPTTYPSPELNGLAPRETILASDLADISNALNFLIAQGAPVVHQCWNKAEIPFARTNSAYSASGNAAWRIPPLGARTDVTCTARVDVQGASGRVRVRSVNTGNTVTTAALAPGEQWVTLSALTCGFGPGYDTLELYVIGDNVDPILVYTFFAEYAPQSSPLAAGTGTDDITAFDAAETAADEPASADMLDFMRRDLVALLARKRGVFAWSGLSDVDDAARGPATMPAWPHRVWSHVMPGSESAGLTWQVYVQAANSSGVSDQRVRVWHGDGDVEGRTEDVTDITVPAAAVAPAWYSKTVQPSEKRPLSALGVPHMMASTGVYPYWALAALDSGGTTTADLYSISIWGV